MDVTEVFMFHPHFKSLALMLPLLILSSACDRKPQDPRVSVTKSAEPPPVALSPGHFAAPAITTDMPVYSANSEDHWAQVAGEPGWTYEWALEGGVLTSGMTADTIRFKAESSGKLVVRCKITDGSGREGTTSADLKVVPVPVLDAFEAAPMVLTRGDMVYLRWVVKDHVTLRLSPATQDVNQLSNIKLQPAETTTYVLTAANQAGFKIEKALEVKVVPPPTIRSFTSEGTSKIGQPMNLMAEFEDGRAEIKLGTTVLAASSESPLRLQVNPTTGTVYTLVVTNEAGTSTSMQASVAVQSPR